MAESPQYKRRLFIIKTVHTVIYIIMVAAIFYIVYAAITKTYGPKLWVSLGLVLTEGLVFVGSGMKCPLTTLAKQHGDPKGYVGDMLLSETAARHMFRIFGAILIIGILVLILGAFKIR